MMGTFVYSPYSSIAIKTRTTCVSKAILQQLSYESSWLIGSSYMYLHKESIKEQCHVMDSNEIKYGKYMEWNTHVWIWTLFMTFTPVPFWFFFNQALKFFCIVNWQFPCVKVIIDKEMESPDLISIINNWFIDPIIAQPRCFVPLHFCF